MKKCIVLVIMLAACGSEDKPTLGNNANNSQMDVGVDTGFADASADQGVDQDPSDQGTSETCETQADCLYVIDDVQVVDLSGGVVRETVIGRDLPLVVNVPMVAGPVPVVR